MNVLVGKLYTVRDHRSWFCDRSADTEIEQNYAEMQKIMVDSARRNVLDLDSVQIHTGTVNNIQEAFQNHLLECYLLWRKGHNVLSVDLDVVFMRPAKWFTGSQFEMFAHTDPPRTAEFAHYLNCGVKVFPASLPFSFWEKLFAEFKGWDYSRYDHEQLILNRLFWAQDSEAELLKLVDHTRVYQALSGEVDSPQNLCFNKCSPEEVLAVHVHGSRGSESRLELMKGLVETAYAIN